MKADLDLASVCNLLGIVKRLPGIGKQSCHLLLGLHIILPALISQTVFIADLFPSLNTQKNVMGIGILRSCVMTVIRTHKFNARFLTHPQQLWIYDSLRGNSMILQFKKKIASSENILIPESCGFRLLVTVSCKVGSNLSRQTGRKRDDPFVIFSEKLQVDSRLIIKALCKAPAGNFHQIVISLQVLRQQDQMIIAVLTGSGFPVKS